MFARSEARRRRHTHAATVVQAALRMHLARKQYLHTRRAVVTIQSAYRGRRDRQFSKDIRCAFLSGHDVTSMLVTASVYFCHCKRTYVMCTCHLRHTHPTLVLPSIVLSM